MSWSQVQVQALIDLYKEHPCLYAVKSAEYKNKHARNDALTKIYKELSKIRPGTSVTEIKAKFNNLRTNFLIQYRKWSNSFHSGMGEDETYKPHLWYFDHMMFMVEHTTPREAIDAIAAGPSSAPSQAPEEVFTQDAQESHTASSDDDSQSVDDCPRNVTQVTQNDQDLQCATPSTVPRPTPVANGEGMKTARKKRKVAAGSVAEDIIIERAAQSLTEIRKAFESRTTPQKSNGAENSQSHIFAMFVEKQLSYIEQHDEQFFLDVQHEITNVLYEARKTCITKHK